MFMVVLMRPPQTGERAGEREGKWKQTRRASVQIDDDDDDDGLIRNAIADVIMIIVAFR